MPPKKKTAKAKAEPPAKESNVVEDVTAAAAPGDTTKADEEVTKAEDAQPAPDPAPAADTTTTTKDEVKEDVTEESKPKAAPKAKASKKRKQAAEPDQPSKSSRRSTRGATKPSQQQLLNFLLTKEAQELVQPDDEKEAIKERGDIRTYSSSILNPFEELASAVILSRPISHRLGLRSIRTVLNDPYNFTSAQAVKDAGEDKRQQALYDAKTQHKSKTADQLGQLAEVVLEKYSSDDDKDGEHLKKLLSDNEDDINQALSSLKESIKGLGNTGLDIFLRRIQWLWPQGYPFADGRTMDGLRKIGLTQDAEELKKIIDKNWSKLETKHLAGDGEAAKKRRAFVTILERSIGADLENKLDEVLEAAASSA